MISDFIKTNRGIAIKVGASESRYFFLSFEIIPSRNGGVEAIEIVDFRVSCTPSGEIVASKNLS